MKTMAIISEYNPFHNGHAYQINQHRTACGVDCVIAVMSGNFVQRGAPAVCDKWTRAEMALSGGADLVIELPVVYATQSAERFAHGAVSLIHSLFGVDYLSFGSECGDISVLQKAAEVLAQDSFQDEISIEMKNGISYPAARLELLCQKLGEEFRSIIKEPNNLLAIEYLKSLLLLKSDITPITLKRSIAHHANKPKENFSSASHIRDCIENKEDVRALIPGKAFEIFSSAINSGLAPVSAQEADNIITYLLRTKTAEELRKLPDMTEGLEYRFIDAARKYTTISEIAEAVKSKRYTRTRIDRTLMHLLLGITKEDVELPPQYYRVLGANSVGTAFLKLQKENSLPVITKVANAKLGTEKAMRMFEIDCRATDIYSMLYPDKKYARAGLDCVKSPVIIK